MGEDNGLVDDLCEDEIDVDFLDVDSFFNLLSGGDEDKDED